jgi:hypothetical protein
MGFDHHRAADESPESKAFRERDQAALRQRFLDQLDGTAKRQYSAGRMGHDDDGDLSFAIAADPKKQVIIMRFGKPVEWIGFGVEDAERLIESLTLRISELRGVPLTP